MEDKELLKTLGLNFDKYQQKRERIRGGQLDFAKLSDGLSSEDKRRYQEILEALPKRSRRPVKPRKTPLKDINLDTVFDISSDTDSDVTPEEKAAEVNGFPSPQHASTRLDDPEEVTEPLVAIIQNTKPATATQRTKIPVLTNRKTASARKASRTPQNKINIDEGAMTRSVRSVKGRKLDLINKQITSPPSKQAQDNSEHEKLLFENEEATLRQTRSSSRGQSRTPSSNTPQEKTTKSTSKRGSKSTTKAPKISASTKKLEKEVNNLLDAMVQRLATNEEETSQDENAENHQASESQTQRASRDNIVDVSHSTSPTSRALLSSEVKQSAKEKKRESKSTAKASTKKREPKVVDNLLDQMVQSKQTTRSSQKQSLVNSEDVIKRTLRSTPRKQNRKNAISKKLDFSSCDSEMSENAAEVLQTHSHEEQSTANDFQSNSLHETYLQTKEAESRDATYIKVSHHSTGESAMENDNHQVVHDEHEEEDVVHEGTSPAAQLNESVHLLPSHESTRQDQQTSTTKLKRKTKSPYKVALQKLNSMFEVDTQPLQPDIPKSTSKKYRSKSAKKIKTEKILEKPSSAVRPKTDVKLQNKKEVKSRKAKRSLEYNFNQHGGQQFPESVSSWVRTQQRLNTPSVQPPLPDEQPSESETIHPSPTRNDVQVQVPTPEEIPQMTKSSSVISTASVDVCTQTSAEKKKKSSTLTSVKETEDEYSYAPEAPPPVIELSFNEENSLPEKTVKQKPRPSKQFRDVLSRKTLTPKPLDYKTNESIRDEEAYYHALSLRRLSIAAIPEHYDGKESDSEVPEAFDSPIAASFNEPHSDEEEQAGNPPDEIDLSTIDDNNTVLKNDSLHPESKKKSSQKTPSRQTHIDDSPILVVQNVDLSSSNDEHEVTVIARKKQPSAKKSSKKNKRKSGKNDSAAIPETPTQHKIPSHIEDTILQSGYRKQRTSIFPNSEVPSPSHVSNETLGIRLNDISRIPSTNELQSHDTTSSKKKSTKRKSSTPSKPRQKQRKSQVLESIPDNFVAPQQEEEVEDDVHNEMTYTSQDMTNTAHYGRATMLRKRQQRGIDESSILPSGSSRLRRLPSSLTGPSIWKDGERKVVCHDGTIVSAASLANQDWNYNNFTMFSTNLISGFKGKTKRTQKRKNNEQKPSEVQLKNISETTQSPLKKQKKKSSKPAPTSHEQSEMTSPIRISSDHDESTEQYSSTRSRSNNKSSRSSSAGHQSPSRRSTSRSKFQRKKERGRNSKLKKSTNSKNKGHQSVRTYRSSSRESSKSPNRTVKSQASSVRNKDDLTLPKAEILKILDDDRQIKLWDEHNESLFSVPREDILLRLLENGFMTNRGRKCRKLSPFCLTKPFNDMLNPAIIIIKPGKAKPFCTTDCFSVFMCLSGTIELIIGYKNNKKQFITTIEENCSFCLPKGNAYRINNKDSKNNSKLFHVGINQEYFSSSVDLNSTQFCQDDQNATLIWIRQLSGKTTNVPSNSVIYSAPMTSDWLNAKLETYDETSACGFTVAAHNSVYSMGLMIINPKRCKKTKRTVSWMALFCREGTAKLTINKSELILQKDQCGIIPKSSLYSLVNFSTKPCHLIYVSFSNWKNYSYLRS